MTERFPVPREYRERDRSPQRDAWCDRLPGRAELVAERWGLTPDGVPGYGFLSVVWPVRDRTGRTLVLKIHDDTAGTDGERIALEAARGPALVELVNADPTANALLLERLDPSHTLLDLGADEACEVIGGLVAEISSHPAPPDLRCLADEADRLRTSITAMLGRTPDVLPRAVADRAVETLETCAAQVRSDPDC